MAIPTAARVKQSDSAHWYDSKGLPCYQVPKKDGSGMRATTITDAKKNNWFPSVTTILKCLAKPALENWKIEQAALAVLTAPRKPGELEDAFVKRVLQTERQQDQEAIAAAERGTAVHNVLERKLKGETFEYSSLLRPFVEPVLAHQLLKGRVIATETRIVGDGYAGMYDCEIENEDPFIDLLDFKTAKSVPKDSSWDEHQLQLAAYAQARAQMGGLGGKRIRCWNVYISTTEPGLVTAFENLDWETTYSDGFAPLVRHWQWRNNYKPVRPE